MLRRMAAALASHSSRKTVSGRTLLMTLRTSSADFLEMGGADEVDLVAVAQVPEIAHSLRYRRCGARAGGERPRPPSQTPSSHASHRSRLCGCSVY